jgi:predicted nucleic acid-binding protein
LIELAVAGGASYVVTKNADLHFPEIRIVLPETFLQEVS